MKAVILQIAVIGMAAANLPAGDGQSPFPSLGERIDAVLKEKASGERTQGDDRTLQEQFDDAYKAAKDIVVPLPAETPVDADPESREIFLRSYEYGYKVGWGGLSFSCLHPDKPSLEHEGLMYGMAQGARDRDKAQRGK